LGSLLSERVVMLQCVFLLVTKKGNLIQIWYHKDYLTLGRIIVRNEGNYDGTLKKQTLLPKFITLSTISDSHILNLSEKGR
jgi:hypothetical protein